MHVLPIILGRCNIPEMMGLTVVSCIRKDNRFKCRVVAIYTDQNGFSWFICNSA
jgi:hypothetical protein